MNMRVIVVGATGKIGGAVVKLLKKKELDVIPVSINNSDINVDISSINSIHKMYKHIGKFDALIATTGAVRFKHLNEITSEDYLFGLQQKLMGQVNLVIEGLKHINDNGSFTLTSGILNQEPITLGTSAAMVNSALEGFATSACNEMTNGRRINIVSPTVITEALETYEPFFKGYIPVDAKTAAMAYYKSISSLHNGRIYKVGF